MTIGSKFLQFRRFKTAIGSTIGRAFKASEHEDNSVSPLQAASTALASTVGTGNIVGTAQAIAMGGPGAVFWLWVTALFGMIIKYAEIFLSLKYRRKDNKGNYVGGPMYYISSLGRAFAPLSFAYAFFALLSALGMGNMSQINSGISAITLAVNQFIDMTETEVLIFKLISGTAVAVIVYIILSGGAKRVGKAAEIIVPFMSLAFILVSLIVLICHAQALPYAIKNIFVCALKADSFSGAAVGIGVREAIHWGIRRSAFSNEAGLGSSAMAHASASVENIAKHSLWGIFEVFADTIVICSATALVILTSGVNIPWNTTPGPELFQNALATVFGQKLSALFMSGSMLIFAFATVVGWSLYGAQCFQYLFGSSYLIIYRLLYCVCIVFGCFMSTKFIWTIADAANGFMAIPNFIALFLLSGQVCRETAKTFY